MKRDSSLRLIHAVCYTAFLLLIFSPPGAAQEPLKSSAPVLIAIRDGVVLQSPDGGTTWDRMKGAPRDARLILPDLRDKKSALVACLGGVYRLSGSAGTWLAVLKLPAAFEPMRLERARSNPAILMMSGTDRAGNSSGREITFLSRNNGITWVRWFGDVGPEFSTVERQ